ncbi:MAG: hypothetical protein JO076_05480 [Verrucomicrobia bacterium]|nr:hypothetical protein [Verrucomicrobiota bacterium]
MMSDFFTTPVLVVPSLFILGMAVTEYRVGSLQNIAFRPATVMLQTETTSGVQSVEKQPVSLALEYPASEKTLQEPVAEASRKGHPAFSNNVVNQYIQIYDDYISEVKTTLTAIRKGNVSNYQRIILRTRELEESAVKAEELLNPAEQKNFTEYLAKRADEIQEFVNQRH